MEKRSNRKNDYLGGLGLLAAVSYLCLKGLKQVDEKLRKSSKKDGRPGK